MVALLDSRLQSLKFGSFGIRSQDTGGFNWWRIDRNFGGWNTFLSLRADGNVGINCTNPGQLLEINGASNPCVLVKDTTHADRQS